MPNINQPPDDPAQSQRFIDRAREVGVDDDTEAFETVVMKIAQTAPQPQAPRSKKK